jgi:capsular polysaccharide biosynthesis protein
VPEYTSFTTLVLTKVNETSQIPVESDSITTSDIALNAQLVSTYSELVKSKKVLRKVISNLNSDIDEETLRKKVVVDSVKDTELIRINVTNEDPVVAEKIANEIAKVFTENIAELYSINNVHILDEAEVENEPSNVNHVKDIAIFTFIGIAVACTYILILNMFDTTVKSVEDIEKMLKYNFAIELIFLITCIIFKIFLKNRLLNKFI